MCVKCVFGNCVRGETAVEKDFFSTTSPDSFILFRDLT